ncbi:MAG: efflux RND transporter periplasmic adaptor subunit [Acidobacteriota bacterium]|nr:efflux RND transporter periplasmic adaptor subunit [Acidobacteriota bacterium]
MPKIRVSLTLACIAMLWGCSSKSKDAGSAEEAPATPVQVAAAKSGSIQQIVEAEAVLYPVRQATITPKITAPVQRFLVQRGDHVHQGQLLAVLEDRDLVASAQESKQLYEQAQAGFENTRSAIMPDDLTKAETDAASARAAVDAARKLFDNRVALFHEGALAQKLVDDAKVALVQAQSIFETAQQHLKSLQSVGRTAQLKSAQAQMNAAKAHYQNSEAQVSYAEVRSPFSGVISDRPVNIGEMASAGSALFSVVDISRIIGRANVPVHEAASIRVGRPATITGPGGELTGKVTVVSPAVDPNTTTVQIWVEAVNKGEILKPGVTAQLSIDVGEIADAVIVPASALLSSEDGGDKVMIAGSDGLAHASDVKTGVRNGDEVQILSGVKPGDQVIIEGGLGLDDKAKVAVSKPGTAGGEKGGEKG